MDAERFDRLAGEIRGKAIEMLDGARELYHEARRKPGDESDAALVLADRALLLVRALVRAGAAIHPTAARLVAKDMVELDAEFRGAAKPTETAEETLAAFGRRLRALREARGKSQAEIGRAIGQRSKTNSGSAVSQWETGTRAPDLHNLLRLAEALGVSLNDLVYGDAPNE